jgi:N-methylhydantoinase B/oxoprolinase/acetone carboxylase alpha subunit
MDPFSVSIAAVGISGTAITSISTLRKTIAAIKDAHEDVLDIRAQLDKIRSPLDALQALVADTDAETNATFKTGMANAVNDCGKACEAFNKRLQKWTRHSHGDKLSLRDKMSVGIWNKERVRTFRTRVETCQRTVHFTISSTQLWELPVCFVESVLNTDSKTEYFKRNTLAMWLATKF